MKTILATIMQKKRGYAKLPFFAFLADETLDPEQRLAFYPCMAHFIMSFGDLNKYVLRSEPAGDEYQQLVNDHSREDDHHWPWYIEDFKKLGFDRLCDGADWLNFLWGERTHVNRVLSYRLANLILNASSVQRLAIIEAIEETGNVLFSLTTRLAEQLEERTGVELRYLGHFHFSLENGHAVGADHRVLAQIEMDEETRQKTLEMVNEVFSLFEDWTGELLRFAEAELSHRPTMPQLMRPAASNFGGLTELELPM